MTEAQAEPKKLSRRAIRLALWLLPLAALANIGFFVWTLDGRPLSSIAERPMLLLLAAVLSLLPWLIDAARVSIRCRFLGVELQTKQIFRVILGTSIANSITPTGTGGTVIKWGFLAGEGVPRDKASTLITLQIAEDTFVLLGLLAICLFYAFGVELPGFLARIDWADGPESVIRKTLLGAAAVLAVLTILYLVAKHGLLGGRIAARLSAMNGRTRDMLRSVRSDWRLVLKHGKLFVLVNMAFGVLQWGARYSVAAAVIGFAGAQVLPLTYWALQWMTFTFSAFIPSPGGIGGTEAAFLLLYAPFVSPERLGPVMVIWRLVMFYVPVAVAALVSLGLRGRVDARPV